MFEFADFVLKEAPEGSLAHGAVADAHAEGTIEHQVRYWTNAKKDQLFEAAAKSIDSPSLEASPWVPRVRSAFAYCFWLMGERDRARREFEQIDPFVTGPFRFAEDPIKTARQARKR